MRKSEWIPWLDHDRAWRGDRQSTGGAGRRGRELSYACTLIVKRDDEIVKMKIFADGKLPDVANDVAEQNYVKPNAPQTSRGRVPGGSLSHNGISRNMCVVACERNL